MFVQARKAKLDTATLGAKILKRKQALMEEMGIAADEESGAKDEVASVAKKKANSRR